MLALTHESGRRLAEVASLLIVIAGIWLIVAEVSGERFKTFRLTVVGAALAVADTLFIIAIRSAGFAQVVIAGCPASWAAVRRPPPGGWDAGTRSLSGQLPR